MTILLLALRYTTAHLGLFAAVEMSVTCGFGGDYLCGYSSAADSSATAWSARSLASAPLATNLGPTTDESASNTGLSSPQHSDAPF